MIESERLLKVIVDPASLASGILLWEMDWRAERESIFEERKNTRA